MDQPISQLPVASALTGNELAVVVQRGVTKQTQVSNIANAVSPGKLIIGVYFDANSNLIFQYSDGTTSSAGPIPGYISASIDSNGHLLLTNSLGYTTDVGNVVGPQGAQGPQGPQGPTGPQGPAGTPGTPGAAATVAVGVTNTGAPGTSASVNNSGTSSNAVFNFTIPRGDVGPTGAAGTSATVNVGTTTTGVPGSIASVTNSGTSTNAVFNFTIPTGEGVIPGGLTGQVLIKASNADYDTTWFSLSGIGTVTSVNASGGTTGLTFSGGPITSAGTLTLGGTLSVPNGGTGATSLTGYLVGNGTSAFTAVSTIPNSGLTNSSLTLGTTNVSLGATSLTLDGLTSVTVTQDPVSALQLATKQYVDNALNNVNYHQACTYATTADLGSVTYNNGSSGVGATITNAGTQAALVIDGHTFTATDVTNAVRILVKNESTGGYNGVYTLTNQGSGSTNWVLTRATDYDQTGTGQNEIAPGDYLFIISGTTNGNTAWIQSTPLPIIIGTTPISFIQVAGTGTYTAGTGLTLTGNQFSLTSPVAISLGGTGQTTASAAFNALSPLTTAGDILYGGVSGAGTRLGIGIAGQVLTVNPGATAPQWSTLSSSAVTSFSAGTTGFTPNTATTGAITLAGTLNVTNGGTGLTSLTSGYIPYGNGTSAFGNSINLQFTGSNLLIGQTYDQGTGALQVTGTNTINGNALDKQLYLQGGNNLALYSQDYSQSAWTKNSATITTAYAAAPDGTTTANRVVFTAGSTSSTQIQQTYTATLSLLTLTVSAWVKSNTGASQTFQLKLTQAGVADHYSADQTATTSWQRFTYTFTFVAGGTGAIIGVANGSDSLAKDLQVWGVQLELGSVASSYTPTTSAIVTTTNNISVPNGSITTSADSTFNTVKVGLGGGNVSSNTAIGNGAINATATGTNNVAIGQNTLRNVTSGTRNVGLGSAVLQTLTTTSQNTAIGNTALANNTGNYNSALGDSALIANTSGSFNTSVGRFSSYYNVTGSNNTALGESALTNNTTSGNLTAIGAQALLNNTTNVATLGSITGGSGYTNGTYAGVVMTLSSGSTATTYPTATIVVSGNAVTSVTLTSNGVGFKDTTTVLTAPAASIGGTGSGFSVPVATLQSGSANVAVGYQALTANTVGIGNTGIGYVSLTALTTGSSNTAVGNQSSYKITTGNNNVGVGVNSLSASTSCVGNVGIGFGALQSNTTGSGQTAVGFLALSASTLQNNTALGYAAGQAVTSGQGNVLIGLQSGYSGTNNLTTGSNNTLVGFNAAVSAAGDSNSIVIGQGATGFGSNTTTIGNSSTTQTFLPYGNLNLGQTYDQATGILQVNGNNTVNGNAVDKQLILQGGNNLIIQSQLIGGTGWTNPSNAGTLTVTTNSIVAPDGTTTATSLAFPAVSSAGTYSFTQVTTSPTISVGQTYTASVWLKGATGGEQVYIALTSFNSLQNTNQRVTLTTSWQRYSITQTATQTSISFYIGNDLRYGGTTSTSAQTVYAWGAQWEFGSVASSYTPTTTTSITTNNNITLPTGNIVSGLTWDQGTGLIQVNGNESVNGNAVDKQLYIQGGNNLLTQSQSFSTWITGNLTVTANSTTAPNSTTTAAFLLPAATATNKSLYLSITANAVAYTNSVYAKAGGYNWLGLGYGLGANNDGAYFNISTGALGTVAAGTTATIASVGNGWYRCTVTRTVAAGTSYCQIEPHTANNETSYTGDGVSGIYIWGGQMEAGSVASAYTPTTTTAVSTVNNISIPNGSITTSADSTFNTVKVGLGGGSVSTNTAVGYQAINAVATGSNNTAVGYTALASLTGGVSNVAVGTAALISNNNGNNNNAVGQGTLYANTSGNQNTGVGHNAFRLNTTGSSSVGIGYNALWYNTTASNHVAVGYQALYNNTIAGNLTAVGYSALQNNTTNVATLGTITGGSGYTNGTYTGVVMTLSSGSTATTYPTATIVVSGGAVTTVTITSPGVGFKDTTTVLTAPAASIGGTGSGFSVPVATLQSGTGNTAVGYQAGTAITTGQNNTALGYQAGTAITTGVNNTAVGISSLLIGTTVQSNTAIGVNTLRNATSAAQNTALGQTALFSVTTGTGNTGIGYFAGYGSAGVNAVSTGSYNTYIGTSSVGNNSNNTNEIAIGYNAVGNGSNTTTLGNTSTVGTYVYGALISPNNTVTVTTNAGTVPTSAKTNTFTNSSAAAMTITMSLTGAVDGQMTIVRIYDFSAVAQTITWVNTENSTVTAPTTSNGSTTLPLTVGFMYNAATTKWRCIAKA